jgi:HEPN domain-containing protein
VTSAVITCGDRSRGPRRRGAAATAASPPIDSVSQRPKHELARSHLDTAVNALNEEDLVVAVTFLHLAAEAAVVAVAERRQIDTQRRHDLKARAATTLHEQGALPEDLGPDLRELNKLRKGVTYEGEEVDLSTEDLEALVVRIESAVVAAEEAAG